MDSCPDALLSRANILYFNSFNGFQGPDSDYFYICLFNNDELIDDLTDINRDANCKTLTNDDWIGHDYLKIHWTEYNKINDVFNVLLKRGYSFTTQTRAKVYFNSKHDKEFSLIIMEEKAIEKAKNYISLNIANMIDDSFCEEWNYITEYGKEFSYYLKEGPLKHKYDTERENFYEWDSFKDYDIHTLM